MLLCVAMTILQRRSRVEVCLALYQLVSVPLNSQPTLLTPVHKDLGSNLDILVELKQCGRFICFCLVYFVLREMLPD